MLFVNDRHGSSAHMQIEPLARRVKVRFARFLDPVTMSGDLAMREHGMRQFLAHRWKGFHLLDENITMTILISHAA